MDPHHITSLAECGPEHEKILDRMLVLELVYVGKQVLEVASRCSSNLSLSMFEIGFIELIVIGVVALIVIGPERLPKVARTAGHLYGRMHAMSRP